MPRKNTALENLTEQDDALYAAMDAALDAAEQVLQKVSQGTIWAGKYEPMQISALFQQHIGTHLCAELIAIGEHGTFQGWVDACKPEPTYSDCSDAFAKIEKLIRPGHKLEPLRRRYFAMVPSWSETRARTIDVIGGNEKDSAGMDAALKYAHRVLGKSVHVKLIPVSDTKPNKTIKL